MACKPLVSVFAVAAILACLAVAGTAYAAVAAFPENVKIGDSGGEIRFTVSNPSGEGKGLMIEAFAPVDSEISAPEFLGAGEKAEVKIKFPPSEKLRGSTYTATVAVTLGGTRDERKITLGFLKAGESAGTVQGGTQGGGTGNGETEGLFNLGGMVTAFGGIFSGATGELLLDIVLVVIAAVLLIAFISRLTARVSMPKNKGASAKRRGNALEPRDPKLEGLKDRIAG
ncbi:MAG: hypothetical protein V1676_05960 [Candidatus Diapherotrites archaeon]